MNNSRNNMAPSKNSKGTIKELLAYAKPFKFQIFIILLFIVLQTLGAVSIPYISSKILEEPIFGDKDQMIYYSQFIIYAALAYALFMYIKKIILSSVTNKMVRNIRQDAFLSLQNAKVSYFDQNESGKVVSKLTNDMDAITNSIGQGFIQLITSIASVLFFLVLLFVTVPLQLSLVILVAIPLLIMLLGKFAKSMFKYFGIQQRQLAEVNVIVEESIYGISEIKLYNQEEKFLKDFRVENKKLRSANFKAGFRASLMGPLVTVVQNMLYVILIVVGVYLMLQNDSITVGHLVLATTSMSQIISPVRELGRVIGYISAGVAGGERVFELINEDNEHEVLDSSENNINGIKGNIEFDNVTFSYIEGRHVLKNLSFNVSQGETVAIVGPTGSGKTTIINLLSKFYDINEGKITIDNLDIDTINKKQLRKHIGVVLQDNYLFKGTVKDNILYGKMDATNEEVQEAAKKANADGFISRLPNGYDSQVESGGKNFSQGERQLISIARTLISNPDLLILDEATSSVDTRTEKFVVDALDELAKNRTSFVIAHRLQTVRNADRIMVINNGELVEFDSHDNLINQKGIYYDLYTTQFRDN